MSVVELAKQLDPHKGLLLHRPDSEPTRSLCPHCLRAILQAQVNGQTITADLYEWLPRGECMSCAHTRHAHPGTKVDCKRCGGLGIVGEPRPRGRLLAIDIAWSDDLHLRIVGPRTDRRKGESLHPLHICQADY